jgi:hypothetical protein
VKTGFENYFLLVGIKLCVREGTITLSKTYEYSVCMICIYDMYRIFFPHYKRVVCKKWVKKMFCAGGGGFFLR